MIALLTVLTVLILLFLWFFLFPVKYVPRARKSDLILEPPDKFIYSYVIHIHTQFSYDSLGKPEDVIRVRDHLGIDYAIVTDHDNDHIKHFADDRLIAGMEIKLNDPAGKLLGDLLEVGDLRVIAHHFRGKYRWRLERPKDYLLELIDLRDALLENKRKLILYILISLFLYPVLGKRIVRNFVKLVNIESYAKRYFQEGWENKVLGGLDHHVKVYIREVGKRIIIPSYELSFSLMRNYVMTDREVKMKEELLEAIRRGSNLISFTGKPAFVWIEEGSIKVSSPFDNTYVLLLDASGKVSEFMGSNCVFEKVPNGKYLVLGYNYLFKIGRLLVGVKPSFISDLLEVNNEGSGKTPARMGKGKNTTEGSK